jgi:hypothetical protein
MDIADWWHEFQNADHGTRESMLIPDSVPRKKRRRSRGGRKDNAASVADAKMEVPAGEGD